MVKELEDIGLSEKEARVYLASLELGPTTAEKLATHAKVNRSTTYVQLESLMKAGLMSTYEEKKKTYFAPESPELLRRLIAKQKDEVLTKERGFAALLPALLLQFEGAGDRPVVRFFPGKEGVTSVREEVLTTKEKKIHLIFSPKHLSKLYSQDELDSYSDRRRALGILSEGIYVYQEYFLQAGLDALTKRRFLRPDVFPLTIDLYMFDDKVAIVSLEDTLFGMIIQSTQITASLKLIFAFLWKHAEEPA